MERGFRGQDGDIAPVPFECEVWGYPNKTTTGEDMYENTHFRMEEEAWRSINRSWEAGVSLVARALKYKRSEVEQLTKDLADEVLKQQESKELYREWLAKNDRQGF